MLSYYIFYVASSRIIWIALHRIHINFIDRLDKAWRCYSFVCAVLVTVTDKYIFFFFFIELWEKWILIKMKFEEVCH